MRKLLLTFFTLTVLGSLSAFACEVCKTQQPAVLQGITHGPGPQGNMDYIIIGISTIIVALTLFYSVKFLIKPQESSKAHIKNIIIDLQLPHER